MAKKILSRGIPLRRIAELTGGKLIGDADCSVTGLCPLDAPEEGAIAFTRRAGLKHIQPVLADGKVAGLICPAKAESAAAKLEKGNLILVTDPLAAVLKLIPLFFDPPPVPAPGISPKAEVSPGAELGADVYIGPFSVIGDRARIGDGAVIHPHVVIYPGAVIGPRSVIHSGAVVREDCVLGPETILQNGAVIGADGFGYIPDPELGLRPVPQVGNVILRDRVEVGANSCVDRATLGTTLVDVGTKLDNLVQIGHNVKIGKFSILCGQVGVSGSARIGNQVVLAGNVGVADHVMIVDGARIGAKAGVSEDILEPGDWAGYPACRAHRWRMQRAVISKLPEMYRELQELLRLKRNTEK